MSTGLAKFGISFGYDNQISQVTNNEENNVRISYKQIIYQIIGMRSLRGGSGGFRFCLSHANLKVHIAFLTYPVSCMSLLWRLSACGVNSVRSEKEVHTMRKT